MKQSLEQKVIEQCRLYGCNLGIYRGSHYIIEANDYGDQRTWITGSHSLTQYIEGNPNDARDFHHITWHLRRMEDIDKLAAFMKSKNLDTTWWENVKLKKQDPWVKLQENDVNNQCKQFQMPVGQMGGA